MKFTIAQINLVVGDINYNMSKILDVWSSANKDKSDLVILPELCLIGYPPRDLLEKPWFIEKVQLAVSQLVEKSVGYPETGILLGVPLSTGQETGKGLYNSALLINNGRIIFSQNKSLLPVYDVFDETRYFEPSKQLKVILFKDCRLGISICEDAWNDPEFWPKGKMYGFDPIEALAELGVDLFINISASPFSIGKENIRFNLIRTHAQKHHIPFVYVNQVGGNDELIFDGRSMFIDAKGEPVVVLSSFQECTKTLSSNTGGRSNGYLPQDQTESIYQALALGIKDYLNKCGFSKAVIGLSGGIDSAVTCCLAVEALGKENVLGISMPSPYSSSGSVDDSKNLAGNLEISFQVIAISEIYDSYLKAMSEFSSGDSLGLTEENIQARIRGDILMAFSNRSGYMVLSTGNKSEMAVGYCTLYGDMSGGLSVLSDVPKTMVYKLADYINRDRDIIPKEIIIKAPSAELKPGQKDQDTLPPYEELDQILNLYIEQDLSVEQLINEGFKPDIVRWVVNTVNKNEYKRRQAAPGLKVTSKAFGVGRRMPVAARYGS